MDRKYIRVLILMFLILLSYIITISNSTDLDLNLKVNKSGDTMTNTLHVPVVSNEDGNYFTAIDFSPLNFLRLTISDDHGLNAITMEGDKTTFSQKIDMAGNNITNCPNCGGGGTDNLTWQNSKVNKSGDNISYLDFNTSTAINIIQALGTTSRIMDFGTGAITLRSGLSLFSRTYTPSTNLTTTQAGSRFILNMTNALCLSGCGVSALAQLTDSRGIVTVGKFAFSKINDSSNTTKVQFYVRSSTADSAANTLAFEATPDNFTVPSKNGTGYEFACWDAVGNLIRSSVSCDLI